MSFYRQQEKGLGILTAWGAASVVAGAGGMRCRSRWTRQAAIQWMAWGLIDLVLAVNGRRQARAHAADAQHGQRTPVEVAGDHAGFRRLLLINLGLDVVYVAGGLLLIRRDRPELKGMGTGIVVQGLFLLIFDGLFVSLVEPPSAVEPSP